VSLLLAGRGLEPSSSSSALRTFFNHSACSTGILRPSFALQSNVMENNAAQEVEPIQEIEISSIPG